LRASQRIQTRALIEERRRRKIEKKKREKKRRRKDGRRKAGGEGEAEDLERTRSPLILLPGLGRYLSTVRTRIHIYVCVFSVRNTCETYVKRRMRDRKKEEERDPVHYTPHNVIVQTPWARRTAFQGGSMDMAHDGVKGSRQEEEKEEEDEEEEEEEEGKEETEESV